MEEHIHNFTVQPEWLPRLMSRVEAQANGCWLWTGGRNKPGWYGRIEVDGRRRLVHCVVYEVMVGPIIDGLHVLHTCDVPNCCNPAHLYLGTQWDNVHDTIARGRDRHARGPQSGRYTHPERTARGAAHPYRLHPELHVRGERVSGAKLTEDDVREIRALHATTDLSPRAIAVQFGVCRCTVRNILRGRTWAHVI